jgi:hypothetical protein
MANLFRNRFFQVQVTKRQAQANTRLYTRQFFTPYETLFVRVCRPSSRPSLRRPFYLANSRAIRKIQRLFLWRVNR